jgi:hypothetical protein
MRLRLHQNHCARLFASATSEVIYTAPWAALADTAQSSHQCLAAALNPSAVEHAGIPAARLAAVQRSTAEQAQHICNQLPVTDTKTLQHLKPRDAARIWHMCHHTLGTYLAYTSHTGLQPHMLPAEAAAASSAIAIAAQLCRAASKQAPVPSRAHCVRTLEACAALSTKSPALAGTPAVLERYAAFASEVLPSAPCSGLLDAADMVQAVTWAARGCFAGTHACSAGRAASAQSPWQQAQLAERAMRAAAQLPASNKLDSVRIATVLSGAALPTHLHP